jgi:hypothetical protein
MLEGITTTQWLLGALVALLAGVAKTGVPGIGILIVPVMAMVFPARESVGALLLLLITADIFAVAFYRQHADLEILKRLIPWVVLGMIVGGFLLFWMSRLSVGRDVMSPFIGIFVLLMLALQLVRSRWEEKIQPHGPVGTRLVGIASGVSTTVANAGGPVMGIYFTAMQLDKARFMGTGAWYFFLLNVTKLPVYLVLNALAPEQPMLTPQHAAFDACLIPAVATGALLGRWVLQKLSQRLFEGLVLGLAAVAAVQLIIPR